MEFKIKTYSALPCTLETFTINGKEADMEDFGECERYGGCFERECCNKFTYYEVPQENVLEKYELTNDEYYAICQELSCDLCVNDCGWCS